MGIGNVATHPRFRGFGYMKACMQASLDEIIEKDIDFGFLGGRRHRYRNFGYEKCSSDMNFSVSAKIMSYFPKDLEQMVTMIEVKESDSISIFRHFSGKFCAKNAACTCYNANFFHCCFPSLNRLIVLCCSEKIHARK
jgi:predicted acetyltransferase